jgi:hypothetical protein
MTNTEGKSSERHLSRLAEKTNKSDAILAKYVCLPFVPRFVGATQCEGAALQASETVFGGSRADSLYRSKGAAANLQGKPKPAGLELASEAPSAGITLKPSPTKKRLKGRRACKKNRVSMGRQQIKMTFGRSTQWPFAAASPIAFPERKEKRDTPQTVTFRVCGVTVVTLVPRFNGEVGRRRMTPFEFRWQSHWRISRHFAVTGDL